MQIARFMAAVANGVSSGAASRAAGRATDRVVWSDQGRSPPRRALAGGVAFLRQSLWAVVNDNGQVQPRGFRLDIAGKTARRR